jgi:hypothetical protein
MGGARSTHRADENAYDIVIENPAWKKPLRET